MDRAEVDWADAFAETVGEMEKAETPSESPPEAVAENEPATEAPKADEPEDEPKVEAEAEPDGEPEQTENALSAPEHWSQLDKDRFADLPDEAKTAYLDARKSLEAGYDKKFKDVAAYAQERDGLDQIFAPIADQMAANGVGRLDAVKQLFSWHQKLSSDPASGIRALAQSYGVDLNQIVGTGQDDLDWEYSDPKLSALEVQVRQIAQTTQQHQAAAEQQRRAELDSQVRSFAQATGPDGKPSHPYFDEVKVYMAGLLQSGTAQDMESAYQMAVYANPETRTQLMKAEKKRADDERRKAAEKARVAEGANVRSRASTSAPERPAADSYEEEMRALMRERQRK